ncbi:hypothetical protein [Streptomyces sp. NPDC048489]|uniref:hypothetical protein n=1 Tax=Streptomyces sp. NPDC048489 TaxID=3154504 RepID=UPI0034166AF0
MEEGPASTELEPPAELARLIAKEELPRIRQRGIADLDLSSHNQRPVSCPQTERLARLHADEQNRDKQTRPALVGRLLTEALNAYEEQNPGSATFMKSLFFDPADASVHLSPSDLLRQARSDAGFNGAHQSGRFDSLRRKEFEKFASFLVAWSEKEAAEPDTSEVATEIAPQKRRRKRLPRVFRLATYVVATLSGMMIAFIAASAYYSHLAGGVAPVTFKADGNVMVYNDFEQRSSMRDQYINDGVVVTGACKVPGVPHLDRDDPRFYYVKIETPPWTGYYANADDFVKGSSQVEKLTDCHKSSGSPTLKP